MFEAYRKLGGDSRLAEVRNGARDLAIRLFTAALTKLPVETPVEAPSETVLAAAIEQADSELDDFWWANGLHGKVLRDTFGRRGVAGYRPQDPPNQVDVYIDDGRSGGYGSDDGQDRFDQTLWKEDHGAGAGKDLWAVRVPYASGAAVDPAQDHVEPAVGVPAHLYVRVRNRGAQPIGIATVRDEVHGGRPKGRNDRPHGRAIRHEDFELPGTERARFVGGVSRHRGPRSQAGARGLQPDASDRHDERAGQPEQSSR